MAKPKFELTAELVKVESEPVQTPILEQRPQLHSVASAHNIAPQPYVTQLVVEPLAQTPVNESEPPLPEIEREAISMKISKTLKKSFHLWCVQQGITMTDAIEAAIKKYLEE